MEGLRYVFWSGFMLGYVLLSPISGLDGEFLAANGLEGQVIEVEYTAPSHPYIGLIAQYDWPVSEAVEIVNCENTEWDRYAVSATNDHGIFQHNGTYGPERFEDLGYSWSDRYDPAINIHVAYELWAETRDWRHWSCAYKADGDAEWNLPSLDVVGIKTETRE